MHCDCISPQENVLRHKLVKVLFNWTNLPLFISHCFLVLACVFLTEKKNRFSYTLSPSFVGVTDWSKSSRKNIITLGCVVKVHIELPNNTKHRQAPLTLTKEMFYSHFWCKFKGFSNQDKTSYPILSRLGARHWRWYYLLWCGNQAAAAKSTCVSIVPQCLSQSRAHPPSPLCWWATSFGHDMEVVLSCQFWKTKLCFGHLQCFISPLFDMNSLKLRSEILGKNKPLPSFLL